MIKVRKAKEEDYDAIWEIIQPIIMQGDTYAFSPETSKEEMIKTWCGENVHAYVAILNKAIVGTFMMKDNQPGLGSHVANAGYMVARQYSGLGIGRTMGEFSIEEARRLGYRGMQFNMVVSTNQSAVRLWDRLGFEIIGEVPEAFFQSNKEYVSVYIMHRLL